jgi:hypothetical protein
MIHGSPEPSGGRQPLLSADVNTGLAAPWWRCLPATARIIAKRSLVKPERCARLHRKAYSAQWTAAKGVRVNNVTIDPGGF